MKLQYLIHICSVHTFSDAGDYRFLYVIKPRILLSVNVLCTVRSFGIPSALSESGEQAWTTTKESVEKCIPISNTVFGSEELSTIASRKG